LFRDPLAGIATVCPVPLDTPLWIAPPGTVIANLVHAARVRTSDLEPRRTVNFPGLSVTPGQMLDSLERIAGAAVRARVRTSARRTRHADRLQLAWHVRRHPGPA